MAEYHIERLDHVGRTVSFVRRKRLDAARLAAERAAYDLAEGNGARDTVGAHKRRNACLTWDGERALVLEAFGHTILAERV